MSPDIGTTTAPVDVAAIRARERAATPGPWRWRGNVDGDDPHLTGRRHDVLAVVARARQAGDREAQKYREYLREVDTWEPSLNDGKGGYRPYTESEIEGLLRRDWLEEPWGTPRVEERLAFVDPVEHLYRDARDLAVYEVCPEATSRADPRVYRADIIGLRNPDAEFIAHSRQDIADLLAEVDRLTAIIDGWETHAEVTAS